MYSKHLLVCLQVMIPQRYLSSLFFPLFSSLMLLLFFFTNVLFRLSTFMNCILLFFHRLHKFFLLLSFSCFWIVANQLWQKLKLLDYNTCIKLFLYHTLHKSLWAYDMNKTLAHFYPILFIEKNSSPTLARDKANIEYISGK